MRRLDKATFRIEEVDPTAHTVRASSKLDLAEGFVDCGTTVWTHTRGDRTRRYEFRGLDTASYPRHDGTRTWHMVREPDELSGDVTLRVEEVEQGTRVSVTARFALEHVVHRRSSGVVEHTRRYTDHFTSHEPSQPQEPDDPVCASTGQLEANALAFALDPE